MNKKMMAEAGKLGKTLCQAGIRYVLPAIIIGATAVSTGCGGEETLSLGESVSDDAHAFQAVSARLVEKAGEATPPEGKSYLIIGFEIENVRGEQDISRAWSQQIQVEDAAGKESELTDLRGLEDQLWNTTLSPQQKQVGYMAFTIPEKAYEFRLTLQLPVSGTVAIYEFRAEDDRLEIRISRILERMEQTERTRRIPVVGRALESFTRAPVQYLGEVLVPEEDIPGLLEQLKGLTEEARRELIEDYVRAQKGWY